MLYKKNYLELDAKELALIQKAENYRITLDGTFTTKQLFRYHKLMPDFGYHYLSLFPNNYLDDNYKKHQDTIHSLTTNFINMINNPLSLERDILNFIYQTESYFILESILMDYNFGHHGSFLFREFELHPNHIVDFLLVGKRSGGFEFVFIEFEGIYKDITTKDGNLGTAFRKGLKQIEDWDTWIDGNYSSLKAVFKKHKKPNEDLPNEFYELDKSRVHFLVVAGRREHFKDSTYRIKRKQPRNIKIMHYDNIIDLIDQYLTFNLKANH